VTAALHSATRELAAREGEVARAHSAAAAFSDAADTASAQSRARGERIERLKDQLAAACDALSAAGLPLPGDNPPDRDAFPHKSVMQVRGSWHGAI